jgi:hypothetical protein
MDPFAVIILGGTGGLVIALLLLGRLHPGSGAGPVDSPAAELELPDEIEDLGELLAATNARRRAHGKPDLTERSLSAEIAQETALANRRHVRGPR